VSDGTGGLQVRHLGFGARALDYESAWAEQRRLHALRVAGRIPDTLLLLEHPAVFTAGKRTEVHERPTDGTPVVDVDRGGKITFHGPGQLVGYPIVALPDHVYVVDYVRRLEEALIRVCADLGLATGRVAGRTGVWRPATVCHRPTSARGRSRQPQSGTRQHDHPYAGPDQNHVVACSTPYGTCPATAPSTGSNTEADTSTFSARLETNASAKA